MKDTRLTWLIEKRKSAGFKSMSGFANHVGLSTAYYNRIERGIQQAGAQAAYKISKALDFDMALFYTQNVSYKDKEKGVN